MTPVTANVMKSIVVAILFANAINATSMHLRGTLQEGVTGVISSVLKEETPLATNQGIPDELSFRFTWETCSQSRQTSDLCNEQSSPEEGTPCNLCKDLYTFLSPNMEKPVFIQVQDAAIGSEIHYFDGLVYPGEEFSVSLSKPLNIVTQGASLKIYVFSEAPSHVANEAADHIDQRMSPSLVQEIHIPISLSEDQAVPLSTCDTFGSLQLIGFENDKQGSVKTTCACHRQE